jgi:hypothetical protein
MRDSFSDHLDSRRQRHCAAREKSDDSRYEQDLAIDGNPYPADRAISFLIE